jgi:hypothetical protein
MLISGTNAGPEVTALHWRHISVMATILLHALSFSILLAASYVIIGNWYCVVRSFYGKHESWIPLVGGMLGCLGCSISPNPTLRQFWWAPLLFDWGSVPGFAHLLVYVIAAYLRRDGR